MMNRVGGAALFLLPVAFLWMFVGAVMIATGHANDYVPAWLFWLSVSSGVSAVAVGFVAGGSW